MAESAASAGVTMPVAPAACTAIGYTANAYCEYTAESPGLRNASASSTSTSFEPLPSVICSDRDAELRGERVLEPMPAAVGIKPCIGERRMHRGERARARPEGVFVGGELDDAADAEFALELFDGFAGHVRRQRAHAIDGEIAGMRHRARTRSRLTESQDSFRNGARIGAEHAEQRRALLQRRERLDHVRLVRVTFDVEEEHVVPLLATRRPRLDARQADLVLRQRLEQPEQRAGRIGMQRGAQDGRAILAAGPEHLASDDEEARGVVVAVFDLGGE